MQTSRLNTPILNEMNLFCDMFNKQNIATFLYLNNIITVPYTTGKYNRDYSDVSLHFSQGPTELIVSTQCLSSVMQTAELVDVFEVAICCN